MDGFCLMCCSSTDPTIFLFFNILQSAVCRCDFLSKASITYIPLDSEMLNFCSKPSKIIVSKKFFNTGRLYCKIYRPLTENVTLVHHKEVTELNTYVRV